MVKGDNKEGVTILFDEQNVRQTLAMCTRVCALENGRIVLEGSGQEFMNNEHVKEAYLGI